MALGELGAHGVNAAPLVMEEFSRELVSAIAQPLNMAAVTARAPQSKRGNATSTLVPVRNRHLPHRPRVIVVQFD